MGALDGLIGASADPVAVALGIDRLGDRRAVLERDDDLAAAVVAVMAASDSLRELVAVDGTALAVLVARGRPVPIDGSSEASLAHTARLELLRLVASDRLGELSFDELVGNLSTRAEVVLRTATAVAAAEFASRDDHFAVVAMGKLGARELNIVSDVDVLFVGEGDPDRLDRTARRVMEVAGRCYRIDANLRPEGRDGQLVRSVSAFADYWERWARPWEFQALLKARPVAGDLALRMSFAAAAERALWDFEIDRDALDEIRRMKRRAETLLGRADEVDVKHAPGGIRDIEFSVQLLQLVHGGSDPLVRRPGTRHALADLAAGGYVDGDEAATLDEAYVHLRRVEHAVQVLHEQQTHSVPADRDRRRRLARSLGYRGTAGGGGPTDAFDHDLAMHRLAVRRVHDGWYFRPLLDALAGVGEIERVAADRQLATFGFTEAQRTREAATELTRGLTRSSRLMQQLLPLLLEWLSESPDPDAGLLAVRRLAGDRNRAAALAAAFRDSAEVARRLCLLAGSSALIGELLVEHPDLVDRLDDADRLRTRPVDELRDSARRAVRSRGEDPVVRQGALRRWHRRHLFGVVARDLLGASDAASVGRDLATLAGVVCDVALELAAPAVPVAVIGLGRIGGEELSYGSDLDIVFVHGGTAADAGEAERVAGDVLRSLGGRSPAARIIDVDPDLRPEGRQGPLARTLDSYNVYLDRWAESWERLALVRARPVAGDAAVSAGMVALLERHVWNRPPDQDDLREVRRLKARMEKERIPDAVDPRHHLKLGPGALADVEMTVQLEQWRHQVRRRTTAAALDRLTELGALDADEAARLDDALRWCNELRNRRWLVCGPGDDLPAPGAGLTRLARSRSTTPAELTDAHLRVVRRSRVVVRHRFYGE